MTPMGQCLVIGLAVLLCFGLSSSLPGAADASNVGSATNQVESGAKQVGRGVEGTARGVGNTVVEGAKSAGEKIQGVPNGKLIGPDFLVHVGVGRGAGVCAVK